MSNFLVILSIHNKSKGSYDVYGLQTDGQAEYVLYTVLA